MPNTVFFKNLALTDPPNPPIHGFTHGVAYFSAGHWWYSGINVSGMPLLVPIAKQDLLSLKAWISGIFGDSKPQESDYEPGTAYKRIALPVSSNGILSRAIDYEAETQSFVALRILLSKMEDIFETVEPSNTNSKTYGHKIRELLLLAAMEVEASWVAVLKANNYLVKRFSTNDYVKLLTPMLLDRFELALRSYPKFPRVIPFKAWKAKPPTQSLDWYDAYNQTKHDREAHLDAATLERAVNAVGAVVVMFYAQFGYIAYSDDEKRRILHGIFGLHVDDSLYPTVCYIPNAEGGEKAWNWRLVDYPFPVT